MTNQEMRKTQTITDAERNETKKEAKLSCIAPKRINIEMVSMKKGNLTTSKD